MTSENVHVIIKNQSKNHYTIMQAKDREEGLILKDRVNALAMGEAVKYGTLSFAITGVATVAASLRNKSFKKFMSTSAKSSLPLMAGLGVFGFKYETVTHECIVNPEQWGLKEFVEKGRVSTMPFHHKVLNYLYDHPFKFVAGIGFPFAGIILSEQLKLKHLTLSQKFMHSRVYAQTGVLSILLLTMAFREYMDKRGRFPEPISMQVDVAEDIEDSISTFTDKSPNAPSMQACSQNIAEK